MGWVSGAWAKEGREGGGRLEGRQLTARWNATRSTTSSISRSIHLSALRASSARRSSARRKLAASDWEGVVERSATSRDMGCLSVRAGVGRAAPVLAPRRDGPACMLSRCGVCVVVVSAGGWKLVDALCW